MIGALLRGDAAGFNMMRNDYLLLTTAASTPLLVVVAESRLVSSRCRPTRAYVRFSAASKPCRDQADAKPSKLAFVLSCHLGYLSYHPVFVRPSFTEVHILHKTVSDYPNTSSMALGICFFEIGAPRYTTIQHWRGMGFLELFA